MGRGKLSLFLILTLVTLLFLVSFVVGQNDNAKEPDKNPNTATAKGKDNPNPKEKTNSTETPTPTATPTPSATPATPITPTDPNLAIECNNCWMDKRKKLSACKGITDEEFIKFNQQPSSPKVASCLCSFADNVEKILNDTCSAVCVDQTFINDMIKQAEQYETNYKCADNDSSILGPSNNLVTANENSAIINGNNIYLGLSFVMGMVSFLFFI